MKLSYREGTWFAVPLRQGGFAVGVVARATTEGEVILCYFFGPRRTAVPALDEVERLNPNDAIQVVRVGDLSLIRGEWPIIGKTALWQRSDWPMPSFVRRDDLSRKAWRVQYSDVNPNSIDHEEREQYESTLNCDAVLGSGAAELVLTKLLTP
ncbi:MAG: immunity 26/phosphotriesterase HocA family protein [Phycisphaerales bacterium]|nr:immunity 26/phosphotriesterase HocA family protein [Phycisphaerales bacterium]